MKDFFQIGKVIKTGWEVFLFCKQSKWKFWGKIIRILGMFVVAGDGTMYRWPVSMCLPKKSTWNKDQYYDLCLQSCPISLFHKLAWQSPVADPGGGARGPCPPPLAGKNRPIGLYFMYLGPLSPKFLDPLLVSALTGWSVLWKRILNHISDFFSVFSLTANYVLNFMKKPREGFQ